MDIVVKSRNNTTVDERFHTCVHDKLGRLAKLDPKADRVDVEVAEERNPRQSDVRMRVELTCRTRGPVIRAEAAAADEYAALDLAVGKLDNRLRRAAGRRRVHHGSRTPVSVATATRAAALEPAAPEVAEDMEDDTPFVVRVKEHPASPMTLDQALFEMELVGHDFYLFIDEESTAPSVVYRRRGYQYGVLRLQIAGHKD
jgi:ribosomal subunit interface protein